MGMGSDLRMRTRRLERLFLVVGIVGIVGLRLRPGRLGPEPSWEAGLDAMQRRTDRGE